MNGDKEKWLKEMYDDLINMKLKNGIQDEQIKELLERERQIQEDINELKKELKKLEIRLYVLVTILAVTLPKLAEVLDKWL